MTLHHQSKLFIQLIQSQNRPGWHEMPIDKSRAVFSSFQTAFGEGPELHSVEDRILDGVSTRIYRPTDQADLPCVMYFHGGGWVIGNLDTHDTLCRRLAEQTQCVVVAVDYRLAPEHRYPAAMDDCYRATAFVGENAQQLGLSDQPIIVAGDSAGGNLACAVSLKSRDKQGPQIALQVMIYPVVEASFATESYRKFATDHGLSAETMQWMWQQYWDESIPYDRKYVVLTEADLHHLPRTHVITAEYDILRDEGESFANQLAEAGVPVTSKRYAGMLHGFMHFSALFDDGLVAIQEIGELIRTELGKS